MRTHVVMALALLGVLGACRGTTHGISTMYVGGYTFSSTERRTIDRIAGDTVAEARKLLPALPAQLTLRVNSGKDVIPEIGATGTVGIDWVFWTVDPDHPSGIVKIAETHLRATLFHELHHLVRGATVSSTTTLMDFVITEGLASAFERDFAAGSYPWHHYPPDVATWVDELLALPPETNHADWMNRELPDGRRWVGMKAGTYLVDLAMKQLNRTSADLVSTPTAEILNAAGR